MAGLFFTIKKEITLSASSGPITLVQAIAAANQRVLVHGCDISMNGVTSSDPPVLYEILTQTTAGTTTGSVTPGKVFPSDPETVQTTATHTASAEPTTGTVICGEYISPLTGGFIPLPKGKIPLAGGGRLGVRYTSAGLTGTVKVTVTLHCEE